MAENETWLNSVTKQEKMFYQCLSLEILRSSLENKRKLLWKHQQLILHSPFLTESVACNGFASALVKIV